MNSVVLFVVILGFAVTTVIASSATDSISASDVNISNAIYDDNMLLEGYSTVTEDDKSSVLSESSTLLMASMLSGIGVDHTPNIDDQGRIRLVRTCPPHEEEKLCEHIEPVNVTVAETKDENDGQLQLSLWSRKTDRTLATTPGDKIATDEGFSAVGSPTYQSDSHVKIENEFGIKVELDGDEDRIVADPKDHFEDKNGMDGCVTNVDPLWRHHVDKKPDNILTERLYEWLEFIAPKKKYSCTFEQYKNPMAPNETQTIRIICRYKNPVSCCDLTVKYNGSVYSMTGLTQCSE